MLRGREWVNGCLFSSGTSNAQPFKAVRGDPAIGGKFRDGIFNCEGNNRSF